MELDERKEKILKAIIQNYLETGEPVGSRTISKYSDLKLSSATIRNEMSDLEELGYIIQPHTSAGRIPSDKGYRFYVDQLIHEKETEVTQVRDMVIQRVDRVELLLKQMAKLLASNTNYATLISGPQYHQTKIKFIQLSRVEVGKLLIVTVLEGNIIKNSIVALDAELTDEDILNLNILLNSGLNGLTMEQINLDVITRMKGQAGERSHIVDVVLSEDGRGDSDSGEEDLQFTPKVRRHFQISGTERWRRKPASSSGHWSRKTSGERFLPRTMRTAIRKMRFRSTSEVRHRCSR